MAEVKRETKTVTFRVDKNTVKLIDLLDQTGKFKSKGEIVDVSIQGLANNQLLGDKIDEILDFIEESNKLLTAICSVIEIQNDKINEMQEKIELLSIDD